MSYICLLFACLVVFKIINFVTENPLLMLKRSKSKERITYSDIYFYIFNDKCQHSHIQIFTCKKPYSTYITIALYISRSEFK